MPFFQQKAVKLISYSLLVLVAAISFSSVFLLNFPLFYQQTSQERIVASLITLFVFLILNTFSLTAFILPSLQKFKKPKNLILLFGLMIFLSVTIAISLNYFWSIPTNHEIEFCFDGKDESSTIIIPLLAHPVTNRLYPPESFGVDNYPLFIDSGNCENGSVTTFYRHIMRYWHSPGMIVFVRDPSPDGKLSIEVNNTPSVINFDHDAEEQPGNEIVIFEGFDLGEKIEEPWDQNWFFGIRVVSVLISALYLSISLFGFTEKIIRNSVKKQKNQEKLIFPSKKSFQIKTLRIDKLLLVLTLLYFIIFGIFMAHTAGQPDQAPHRYYSLRYSETWGIPEEDFNKPYVISGQPYLAYWLNGAVNKVFRMLFPASQLRSDLLWRLVSVILSTFTVFYLYKLGKKATGNPYAGVLAAFFLSNTLMFVFMSGGISYDNLMNLASMAAIYHLVCLYKKEDFLRHTSQIGIWVVVGALSKEQFLLMTLIIFLAWLYFLVRNFRNLKLEVNPSNIALSVVMLAALGLFIGLYGVNLIRYGMPTPACYQVKGIGNCGAFSYRSEFYSQFSLPGLWYRRDTFQNPINYAFEFWIPLIIRSTWGIFSHNTFMPKLSTALHSVLLLWTFTCLARYWKNKDDVANILIYIIVTFVGFMFFYNYKQDVEYDFRHYAVAGRYLFPSIGALLTLMIYYFSKLRSLFLKRLTIIIATLIYFGGGLWMFLSRYSEVFIHWRIFF